MFVRVLLALFILLFAADGAAEDKAKAMTGKQNRDVAELEEIVVTATRTEKRVEDAPGAVHVITKEDMARRDIQTIDNALNTTAGVFNRRYAVSDTQAAVSLHGIPDQKRTLVMMDGIALNNAYDGGVSYSALSVKDIERVEVVQGPFSSLYGGNAMGGAVNIITRMPDKREISSSTGYGSAWHRGEGPKDLFRQHISYGDRPTDKVRFLMSYGYKSTNGYPKDLNVQSKSPPAGVSGWTTTSDYMGSTRYLIGDKGDNAWWDDSLALKLAFDASDTSRLSASYTRTRLRYAYNDPNTYLTGTSGSPVYTYTNGGTAVRENSFDSGFGGREVNLYAAKYETELGPVKARMTFGLNDETKAWYTTPNASAPYATLSGGLGSVSSSPSQNGNTDLQFTVPLFDKHILTFGGSYRYDSANTEQYNLRSYTDETSTTNLTYNAGGKTKTTSGFIQDEILLRKDLTAYVGMRADMWQSFDGYANQFGAGAFSRTYETRDASALSPKLALVYKPFDRTTLRASAGQAFRGPTVYELYRTWVSASGVTYNANPDLKPETVRSWDIGMTQGLWTGAKFSITYFENYMTDLIYRKSVSTTQQDYVNAGQGESKGATVEIEQRIHKWLRLFGNLTYTDARITKNSASPLSEGKRVTFMPDIMLNIGGMAEKGPFTLSLTGRYVGKRYGDDQNRDHVNNVYTSYDPFVTADARVSYKAAAFAKISVSVNNIAGETHYEYYRTPGRSWFCELELLF